MSTHYQVIAGFSFSGSRPVLVSLSFHSTYAACTSLPFNPPFSRFTTNSRIFATQKAARSYVAHLLKVYPNSGVSYPVLDSSQPLLL